MTLSKRGEGATIEYKTCAEQISESLYETVCSFLNHNGGKILVGVRDSGEIVGVNSEKTETRNILRHAPRNGEMSQETNVNYNEDDWRISLEEGTTGRGKIAMKKQKRQQGIIGLIRQNPGITIEEMAERLDVNERTVKRDIEELRNVIAHIGPTKGGTWVIIKK